MELSCHLSIARTQLYTVQAEKNKVKTLDRWMNKSNIIWRITIDFFETRYSIDSVINARFIRTMISPVTLNSIRFFAKKRRDNFYSRTYRMRF